MKIRGSHVYLGNPDKRLTDEEKKTQHDIKPSTGPQGMLSGLLSVGEKSRQKILDRNALPPSIPSSEKNKPENIAALKRATYQGSVCGGPGRYYQGTTEAEVRMWRQDDMDPAKKLTTSVVRAATLPEFRTEARRHDVLEEAREALCRLYFTPDKRVDPRNPGASEYAVMKASESDPPKLNRSFFSQSLLKSVEMEKDPMSGNGMRTTRIIPNGYTLQSKNDPVKVTLASEAFKEEFNNNAKERLRLKIDTVLTSEQAAAALHEQQTPSATDVFPPLEGRWAALDYRHAESDSPDSD